MFLTLPLVRTDSPDLTPMEQTQENCETMITAMMTAASLADCQSDLERESFSIVLSALYVPAEA